MHYFCIFLKRFNNPRVNLLRVWTKNISYWKFWENFRKCSKILFRKLLKCFIFAYFSISLANHALLFRGFGRKTKIVVKFWENFENYWWIFNKKILFLFYFYFRTFVTKNRSFGNNAVFLQQFFGFPRDFPSSPWLRPWIWMRSRIKESFFHRDIL